MVMWSDPWSLDRDEIEVGKKKVRTRDLSTVSRWSYNYNYFLSWSSAFCRQNSFYNIWDQNGTVSAYFNDSIARIIEVTRTI